MKKVTIIIIIMLMILLPVIPAKAECVDNGNGTYTYSGDIDVLYVSQPWATYSHFNKDNFTQFVVSNITGSYSFTAESKVAFYWDSAGLKCIFKQDGNYASTFPGTYGAVDYLACCNKGTYNVLHWCSQGGSLTGYYSQHCIENPYYNVQEAAQEDFDLDVLLNMTCLNYFGIEKWQNNTIDNMGFPIFDSYENAKNFVDKGSMNGLLNGDILESYDSSVVLPESMEVIETDTENHVYSFNITYPQCGQYYVRGTYYFEINQEDMIFTTKVDGEAAALPSSPLPILNINDYQVAFAGITSEDHLVELYDDPDYQEESWYAEWEELLAIPGGESSKSDYNVKNLITFMNQTQHIEKIDLVIEFQSVILNDDGTSVYGDTIQFRYDCKTNKSSYRVENGDGETTEKGDQGAGYVDMIPGPLNATLFTHDKTVFTFDWYMDTLVYNDYPLNYTLSYYYEYSIHNTSLTTDRIVVSSMEQHLELKNHNTVTGIGSNMDWSAAAVYCPDGVDIYNYLMSNADSLDLVVVYQNGYYETSRLGSYWTKGREYTYRYNIIKNTFSGTESDGSGNIIGSSGGSGIKVDLSLKDFLNFAKDGFGLLGSNGLIAFFASLFSYMPSIIWEIIIFGLVVSMVVSLFLKVGK